MFRKLFGHGSSTSCSFCKKNHSEVVKLIAGPGTYICNECVGVCSELLKREMPEQTLGEFRTSVELLLSLRDKGEISPEVCTKQITDATLKWFELGLANDGAIHPVLGTPEESDTTTGQKVDRL